MIRHLRTTRRSSRAFVVLAAIALFGVTTVRAAEVGASTANGRSSAQASSPPVAARFYGSMGGVRLNRPIVGMAATPTGKGYWLVASDGGIFSFGDAHFDGSMGGVRLNQPIVGIAATPTGMGYWLVASDGGIFSFGDARFLGSMGAVRLNRPVVGMAATPTGMGYWLVASDGGIFSFGDARFLGSTGNARLSQPVVGMAAMPTNQGYWFTTAGGKVYAFGTAHLFWSGGGTSYFGGVPDVWGYEACDPSNRNTSIHHTAFVSTSSDVIVGIAATRTGGGYWLASPSGHGFVRIATVPGAFSGAMGGCVGPAQLALRLEFGDAASAGYQDTLDALPALRNVVGYATTPRATGLWVVASDGGVFVPRCGFAPPETCKI